MEIIVYAKIDNFIIGQIIDDGKSVGFTVCDKNNERYTNKNFKVASSAIEWANKNFKELCE